MVKKLKKTLHRRKKNNKKTRSKKYKSLNLYQKGGEIPEWLEILLGTIAVILGTSTLASAGYKYNTGRNPFKKAKQIATDNIIARKFRNRGTFGDTSQEQLREQAQRELGSPAEDPVFKPSEQSIADLARDIDVFNLSV